MAPSPQRTRQRLNHSTPAIITPSFSIDHHLESVLALSDPSVPFDLSLERILESRVLESDKENLIHVALRVGSALVDAANRSARRLAAAHNSLSWPLPPELTVKVLSFLDTTSLCHASATCTTFSKCTSDPLCYENIDLTRNGLQVHNSVVSTMIQRAGKNIKSLKLGLESRFDSDDNMKESPLTKSCLIALTSVNGFSGAILQKLCLHHIDNMDTEALIVALSDCKSLLDLEIVGVPVDIGRIMPAVSNHCPLIERLCFDYNDFVDPPDLEISDFKDVIKKCNMLYSLTIRGCVLYDYVIYEVIKGLRKLKYADFSSSTELKGSFFRDLGNGDDFLETLILRDCPSLLSDPMGEFLNAILAGKWKSLRFLDVSSGCRQIIECGVKLIEPIKESRPEICFFAEFHPREEVCCYLDSGGTSSSGCTSDEDTQIGDEQNLDSSSDDQDAQNRDEQNLDSSPEDEIAQNGDEIYSDSSSDDQVTQIGDEHNLDSSSDDQVQDH